MRQVRRRFLIEWVLMFLLLPSIIVWLDSKPGLVEANSLLSDKILLERAPEPSNDILIVGIDKRSLDALGSWPLPRSLHAQLLDRLAKHSPKAVLLDIFFDGPAQNPRDDELLAESLGRVNAFLPLNFIAPPPGRGDVRPSFTPPIDMLAKRAVGIGHANATPDRDGLVRGIWRVEGTAGKPWPYVGLAMVRPNPSTEPVATKTTDEGTEWIRQGRFNVAFAGPAGTYPTVPYVDALRGDIADELIRGKFILIGALGSTGLDDTMPVAGIGALTSLPGVEIHANAIDALLSDRIIEVPADWRRVLWISFPIWAALVLFLRSAGNAVVITLAIALACIVTNYAALVHMHVGLPMASPLCGVVLAYLLWSWRRLEAVLVFFRQRAEALNAVPAGAFETAIEAEISPLDSIEQRTHALDRAIERLTRLQSLLTEGVWQLPVPVLICKPDGVISQSNAAARALLAPSSPPPGAAGAVKADPLINVHLPSALAELKTVDLPDPKSNDTPKIWERAMSSEFTTRQGNVFRLRAAALNDRGHVEPSGWVVVLPDVTAERRAQREREQWFGFLSHDLRGPQVTILSLLGLYVEGAPNVDIDRLLTGVGSEARRTIHLAESFMDMVEAESGVYRFAPTFAGSVVLDAIDAVWPSANSRGLSLTPRLGSSECVVLADSSLIARALINLLNNSIKASKAGDAIFVCIETDPDADMGRGEVVISVHDQGRGLNPNQVDKLMRNDERRKSGVTSEGQEVAQGWGIGMAIVHAVISRHGGWIDVVSAPNEGTTFFIGLPLAPSDAQVQD